MNKIVSKMIAFGLIFTLSLAFTSSVSAECFRYAGNGDTDVFRLVEASPGERFFVEMTTGQNAGTLIIIDDLTGPNFHFSVEFDPIHTGSLLISPDSPIVIFYLDWEFYAMDGNTYFISTTECFGPDPAFTDGRINNYDSAAPVVVYPNTVDGQTGLSIYSADGTLLFVVTAEQLASASDNPASPELIAGSNGVTLHRIPGENGGQWQINAPQYNGKTYVLIFTNLFVDGGYTSFEIE